MSLQKIFLSAEDRDQIEALTGLKIHLRNNFGPNQEALKLMLEQSTQNALIYLNRHELGQKLNIFEENNLFEACLEIGKKLGLKATPRRLECYDISHLSGKFAYGSMVTFIDGKPAKKFYRLFKVKDQNDDFANHKAVLERRFKRCLTWLEENPQKLAKENPWMLPDLIIVDGGKGQLSGDEEVLEEYKQLFWNKDLNFEVGICALAKKEEEVFLPNQSSPVIFQGSARFLLQRIRDEAHRFAITNNRKARLKTAHSSELDKIPGIGPKTRQKLLSTFQSVENLIDVLWQNSGAVYELVGKKITEKLLEFYKINPHL